MPRQGYVLNWERSADYEMLGLDYRLEVVSIYRKMEGLLSSLICESL